MPPVHIGIRRKRNRAEVAAAAARRAPVLLIPLLAVMAEAAMAVMGEAAPLQGEGKG